VADAAEMIASAKQRAAKRGAGASTMLFSAAAAAAAALPPPPTARRGGDTANMLLCERMVRQAGLKLSDAKQVTRLFCAMAEGDDPVWRARTAQSNFECLSWLTKKCSGGAG
jgi:hypothetical protein